MPSQWSRIRTSWLITAVRRVFAPVSFSLLLGAAAMLGAIIPARPVAAQGTVPALPAAPEWIEPRGLSIVDMVGTVPEDQLRDAILVYLEGSGMVQYVSGSRSGNTVVINTKITPRYGPTYTKMGCLGQPAVGDQIPVVVPAGTMQVFANGQDITPQIVSQSSYIPAGLNQPLDGSGGYLRYSRVPLPTNGASPARIPANASCEILINGVHKNMTARFAFTVTPQVSVTPMGGDTFQAYSYIGPGEAGALKPLADAMRRYGDRHSAFSLTIPADADYMFVKYPPTPFDPYAADQYSYGLPGSGTYRFELYGSYSLSVDHVNSMGIPTWGSWNDADLSRSAFLNAAIFRGRIKTPEYFLPPGIPFDQCMVSGGCSTALLDLIYAQPFEVHVYYYKVERLAGTNLLRVPLKMVGKSWSATAASATPLTDGPFAYAQALYADDAMATLAPAEALQQIPVFLPIVGRSNPPALPPPPPDDPTGCPCGWFDAQGQMYDFIPPQ